MPALLNENESYRLVIVGDGPERAPLETMTRSLGLEKSVYLMGRKSQEELSFYLAAADIFVLNSFYEGCSFQILEAMAAGVPVVATTSGGIPERIRQGENGFMVPFDDEASLLAAIKALRSDGRLRDKFIEEGRKTAAIFTPERAAKETIELLESVLASRS